MGRGEEPLISREQLTKLVREVTGFTLEDLDDATVVVSTIYHTNLLLPEGPERPAKRKHYRFFCCQFFLTRTSKVSLGLRLFRVLELR
jgi:hypothetical protein